MTISTSVMAEPAATQPTQKPKRKQFASIYKLPADQAARQGRITFIAWDALGRDAALPFLNSHDEALGGRPLDIATASDAGFMTISQAIIARTASNPSA